MVPLLERLLEELSLSLRFCCVMRGAWCVFFPPRRSPRRVFVRVFVTFPACFLQGGLASPVRARIPPEINTHQDASRVHQEEQRENFQGRTPVFSWRSGGDNRSTPFKTTGFARPKIVLLRRRRPLLAKIGRPLFGQQGTPRQKRKPQGA